MTATTRGARSARRTIGVAWGIACTAVLIAACGTEEPSSSPGSGSGGVVNGPVATKEVDGIGTVLVDSAGRTLYFTDTDQISDIKCVAECLQLWLPVTAPADTIEGAPVGELSVIPRPDGTRQVAYQNKPLYTFTQDTPGQPAAGHNASDTFGGVNFTWHAAVIGGAGAQPPANGGYGPGYGGGY